MTELIDLTLMLGSEWGTAVLGLIGEAVERLQTHETHARCNTKLTPATHIGAHVDAPYHFHANGVATRAVARIL